VLSDRQAKHWQHLLSQAACKQAQVMAVQQWPDVGRYPASSVITLKQQGTWPVPTPALLPSCLLLGTQPTSLHSFSSLSSVPVPQPKATCVSAAAGWCLPPALVHCLRSSSHDTRWGWADRSLPSSTAGYGVPEQFFIIAIISLALSAFSVAESRGGRRKWDSDYWGGFRPLPTAGRPLCCSKYL